MVLYHCYLKRTQPVQHELWGHGGAQFRNTVKLKSSGNMESQFP